MHVLVLGGTGFLSRAVVDAALARDHAVTAVTRGRRGAPPEGARHVVGDRDDVASLAAAVERAVGAETPLDAVVDTSGYTVAGARAATDVLAPHAPRYVYVSSISAYAGWPPGPVRGEGDPTFPPDADLDQYGPMKAESERVVAAAFDRALLVRAGLIVGPGDDTRRLTAWLDRLARHERLVVPDRLDQPMAFVDARDLAGWMVRGAEAGWAGPVTATGPRDMTTLGEVLEAGGRVLADDGVRPAELVRVPEADLLAAGVQPWTDLPFWLPAETAATAWDVDTTRARELGLPSRPIAETLADTWAWLRRPGPVGGADLAHPPLPDVLDPARWA